MYGALVGVVGGVGLGLLADRCVRVRGWRKLMLLASCLLGALGFGIFALACDGVGPFALASDNSRLLTVYIASIFGSLWANAATPLFLEMAVEATYPVAEGLTTAAITLGQNGAAFAALLIPQVPVPTAPHLNLT